MLYVLIVMLMGKQPVSSVNPALVGGILAVRGHMRHVDQPFAERVVRSVRRVVSNPRYSWIAPELLIGLAVNESDLRAGLRVGYDCGITQVRVVGRARTPSGMKRLCASLSSSMDRAFEMAAETLTINRDRYCTYWYDKARQDGRYRWKLARCVLNVYNQGPFYLKSEKCGTSAKCKVRSRYWLRVLCFASAIKNGRSGRGCRRIWSLRQIRRRYTLPEDLFMSL